MVKVFQTDNLWQKITPVFRVKTYHLPFPFKSNFTADLLLSKGFRMSFLSGYFVTSILFHGLECALSTPVFRKVFRPEEGYCNVIYPLKALTKSVKWSYCLQQSHCKTIKLLKIVFRRDLLRKIFNVHKIKDFSITWWEIRTVFLKFAHTG